MNQTYEPFESQQGPNQSSSASAESASTAMRGSPHLSHRGLTILLGLMCVVPVVTILTLWKIMPPVFEGQLDTRITSTGLPDQDFYAIEYYQRDEFKGGELVITNLEEVDWTHLNIQINNNYQIYDIEPIPAKKTRTFKLEKFVSRAGAAFSVRYNELKSARIYARRPSGDRATSYCEFVDGEPIVNEAEDAQPVADKPVE